MKTKLLLLLLLGWAGVVWGQVTEVKEDGNYYFNFISLKDLQSMSNESSLNKLYNINNVIEEVSGTKYRIKVKKVEGDKVYFTFWKFKSDINNLINNADPGEDDTRVEYTMSVDKFKSNTKPIYDIVTWRAGFFTTPFKLRFKQFTFDANVNLGINVVRNLDLIGKEKMDLHLNQFLVLDWRV